MKRQDIIRAYQLLLGRDPESDFVVEQKLKRYRDTFELVEEILNSKEFKSKECVCRLTSMPTDKKLVIDAYALLLGRLPESDNVINEKIQVDSNLYALINGITGSAEYRAQQTKTNINRDDIKYIVNDRVFNLAPKIIYLHIPKTAGSSFHQLAAKNFKGQVCLSMPSNIRYEQWISSRLVGGHYFYSHYNDMTADRLFLAVVRDPVDRAFSHFNFYKHAKDGMEDKRMSAGFNPTSLKSTIEGGWIREEFVDNYQCLYLSGERNFSAFQQVIKNDYFIVGTFDKLDDWLRCLGEKLGWKSLTMPKINVAPKSTYMDELKSDSELVEMIRDLNKEDMKLYDFIRNAGVFTNCGSDFNFDKFIK